MFLKLSLEKRIYVSMLTLIILSFLAIGFTSFYQFKTQNERYHSERLKRKEKTILDNIFYLIKDNPGISHTDSITSFFDEKIFQLADVNNLDINIFNLNGNILISSNPLLFEKKALSSFINNSTLQEILNSNQRIVVEKDSILLTYSLIKDKDNKILAILNLPYLKNSFSDKKELNEFFITLTKVYILLFFGAILLAFFLSRYITDSLKKIEEKLKGVDIQEKAPLLKWESNDEIGALIKQYNKMVIELEKSTEKLIKSERENAWKKMAKQVAHEIKNPLTPMKLSVQHLQKTLKKNDNDFNQKIKNFSKTLITQIETLSSIATAFSDFASMPISIKKPVDLVLIITEVVELFKGSNISFKSKIDSAVIIGDKKQLTRVMNNLITNSIEAIPEDSTPKITIEVIKKNSNILFSLSDNGIGINKNQQKLIFEPNFTTKTSGTGLGLAMVKNIIESIKGKIWINSKSDIGTTFFISFPILKNTNNE